MQRPKGRNGLSMLKEQPEGQCASDAGRVSLARVTDFRGLGFILRAKGEHLDMAGRPLDWEPRAVCEAPAGHFT